MQVNIKTDYATRIVIYLAGLKEITNAAEISGALEIPRTFVPKVLKGLIDSGIIASKEGMGGGYYLAKPAAKITLLDIFASCEPTMKISRCMEVEGGCPAQQGVECPILDYYIELLDEIKDKLRSKTIDKFL